MPPEPHLYDVGGVLLPRPFAIRRLNHFGLNTNDTQAMLAFYRDVLGFRRSDTLKLEDGSEVYFLRHNSDHHTLVLIPAHLDTGSVGADPPMVVNQMTWQLGTLAEVVEAETYLRSQDIRIWRAGRDMPGSNWHVYFPDPDGYTQELEYGIEQIGWDGRSKPSAMNLARHSPPTLPVLSDRAEVDNAIGEGVDLRSGTVATAEPEETFDVGGVLLARPFKVVRIGPVSIFVEDTSRSERFYSDVLGFETVEETLIEGHRCVFMRCGNEHHSVVLVAEGFHEFIGIPRRSLLALGLQVATFRQLRDATAYLAERGAIQIELPPQLHLGIDYAVHFLDPDGNLIQLYFAMEQVGWSGQPRPSAERNLGQPWPDVLQGTERVYDGETFGGPLG